MEIWEPIEGTHGQYDVSNMGRVRNNWTGRELTQTLRKDGRVQVRLSGYINKPCYVSQLVGKAFLRPGCSYRHKGDITDNRVTNLIAYEREYKDD